MGLTLDFNKIRDIQVALAARVHGEVRCIYEDTPNCVCYIIDYRGMSYARLFYIEELMRLAGYVSINQIADNVVQNYRQHMIARMDKALFK